MYNSIRQSRIDVMQHCTGQTTALCTALPRVCLDTCMTIQARTYQDNCGSDDAAYGHAYRLVKEERAAEQRAPAGNQGHGWSSGRQREREGGRTKSCVSVDFVTRGSDHNCHSELCSPSIS